MKTTSFRLPDRLVTYIERTDTSATDVARKAIQERFLNDIAGVCADTGEVVFINDGHTCVSASTPLAMTIHPESKVQEFDLCESSAETGYEKVSTKDADPMGMKFLNEVGPYKYQAIRHALVDLDSDKKWKGLVPNSNENPLQVCENRTDEQILADLLSWSHWKETAENPRSDSLTAIFDFTTEEILQIFDESTIEKMYDTIPISDLNGAIPESVKEAKAISQTD